ncbi:hypothetical protein GEMRC1_003354 [Eukaryota sp. GEM-RC1]
MLSALSVIGISGVPLEVHDVRSCDSKNIYEQRSLELHALTVQSTQQVQQVEIPVVEESAHPIDIDTTKRLQFLSSRWSVDEKINKVKHLLTIFELQKL